MEVCKRLKTIKTFQNYMEISQELAGTAKNLQNIQFNMSTMIALKNVRSLEIEYFNKCDDSGATIRILQKVFEFPPSKSWHMLGKEVISLIQYWLDAVRKHLITHNINWWSFLKQLLIFVKQITSKDPSLNNTLIEETAECLLDLATNGKLDVLQRHAVLHTFNWYSANTSREIRMAYREQFEHYFIRLATISSSCGHLPTQYSIIETLMRWLLPRQDQAVRKEAAGKWFPLHLYKQSSVNIFLERPWMNFFQDARDFLNSHNENDELITSIICKKLTVGKICMLTGTERRQTWLDINVTSRCMSILLDPLLLDSAGLPDYPACEALVISCDNTVYIQFYRESADITISVKTILQPQVLPSNLDLFAQDREVKIVVSSRGDLLRVDNALRSVFLDKYQPQVLPSNLDLFSQDREVKIVVSSRGDLLRVDNALRSVFLDKYQSSTRQLSPPVTTVVVKCPKRQPQVLPTNLDLFAQDREVKIVVSSRGDFLRVDNALRSVFLDKYQVHLDFNNLPCLSPLMHNISKRRSSRDEETRFSIPAKDIRRKRSGYVVKSCRPASWKSPSTASTTSLAQLHDKLAALPSYAFDKEPVSVCLRPELSDVAEIAESEYSLNSTASTLKLRPGGYFHRKNYKTDRHSHSDGELAKNLQTIEEESNKLKSQSDNDVNKKDTSKELVNSSLFAATIGSADESVISATLERFPYTKGTDNLIELLVQEALQSKEVFDSGVNVNTGENNEQELDYSEAIENTPYADVNKSENKRKSVVSKSTSDESNTEAINDTPMAYVSVRKKNLRNKSVDEQALPQKIPEYDNKRVEDFFSQHFSENKNGELIISPTLAKKINETSSDTSEDFDHCLISNVNTSTYVDGLENLDIIECLNSMVDQVCNEFEKCTEYLERGVDKGMLDVKEKDNMPLHDIGNLNKSNTENPEDKIPTRAKGKVLKYPVRKQKAKAKKNAKNKLNVEPVPKMSTILEVNTETDVSVNKTDRKTDSPDNKNDSSDPPDNKTNSLIRRKRKLYSPKDDVVVHKDTDLDKMEVDSVKSDDIVLADISKGKTTPKTTATCYMELEKERKQFNKTRNLRSRLNVVSPKTKQLNDAFDHLKDTVEGEEKIMLADKKNNKDIAVYNYTSDSDDEEFKQRKIELQKRTSTTTVASGNSIISTRRGRSANKINNDEKTDTVKKPNTRRKKTTKRNTRSKKIVKGLIDERMRDATEVLETSLVVEKDKKDKDEILVPTIKAPEVEHLEEVQEINLDEGKPVNKSQKITNKAKKLTQAKKEKAMEIANEKITSDKEGTMSPLPGLVVETVTDKQNLDDSLTTNMVQKFKRVLYQEGPDAGNETNVTNTTQNLLSDYDRVSPQMNITDEFNRIEQEIAKNDNHPKTSEDVCRNNPKTNDINVIEEIQTTDMDVPKTDESGSSTKKKRSLRLKNRIPSATIDNSVKIMKKSKIKRRIDNVENILITEGTEKVINTGSQKTELINNTERKSRSKEKSIEKYREIENIDVKGSQKTELKRKTRSKEKSIEKRRETVNTFDVTVSEKTEERKMRNKEKSIEKHRETITISDLTEIKSEKSIATVGITAHGDVDELPPSSESPNIGLPREIIDMDNTIKEYYVNLYNQMNASTDKSHSSKETTKKKNGDEISIKTSTPQKSQKRQKKAQVCLRSQKSSSSSEERSVSVALQRLSQDISKWLPSRPNSSSGKSETNNSDDEIRKFLPSLRSSSPISKQSSVKLPFKKPKKQTTKVSNQAKRKSLISPINFDESLSTSRNTKNDTLTSRVTTKNDTTTSRVTTKNTTTSRVTTKNDTTSRVTKESKIDVRKYITRSIKDSQESMEIPKSPLKRKAMGCFGSKRIRESPVVDISSVPSASSVDDWFKRNTFDITKEDQIGNSARDVIQNVIEKLETTVSEVHEETSKNFIHLFVDTQRQLTDLKAERHEMYKQTATNILTKVRNIIDEEFMELDRRAQEKDDEFAKRLKQQAAECIKQDCRKKRAMVLLLKEDAQAVLDHIEKMKRRGK